MSQAIPTVYNKLFGISYLQDKQLQQLKDQWQLRMGESDAFFIEAKPSDDYETTVTALRDCIQKQGITVNSKPCILTFFVDLQKEIDTELLGKIEAGIKSALKCSIQTVIQFGYAGELGLKDPAVQRERACKLVDSNREFAGVQHRLCLVASSFLAVNGRNEWKSVCVYLDVLSRQAAPSNLMPGTGSGYAGFLRYEEFNQAAYDGLMERLTALIPALENGGSAKFEELLKKKEQELRNNVKQRFPINGDCHPLHPDMFLEPGLFNKNHKKAQKGNHSKFNIARVSSEDAVWMTGERLKKDIAKDFEPSITNAESILKKLAEAAPLGFGLRENRDEMTRLLTVPADGQQEPPKISLPFRENSYAQEICDYLEKIREYTLSKQVQRFYEALQGVIHTLADEDAAKRKAELVKEQKILNDRLAQMLPPEKFCQKYGFAADLPEGVFSPVGGNGSVEKFLLCSDNLRNYVDNYLNGAGTKVYCMAKSEPDGSPLKAVQIVFLACPEGDAPKVMNQLLPEVKV